MNGVDPAPQDVTPPERPVLTAPGQGVRLQPAGHRLADRSRSWPPAKQAGIPVVGVYETMPTPGYDYQSWMLAEVQRARAGGRRQVSTREADMSAEARASAEPPARSSRSRGSPCGSAGATVLDDVSFTIAPGEFTGLIGSNGAGKTTLFRVILGLQAPERGAACAIGGGARSRRDPLIGYVPQKFLLDPDMPLRGRDLVGARPRRRIGSGSPLPSRARRERVDEMLDAVDAARLRRRARRPALRRRAAADPDRARADQPTRSCCCSTSRSRTSTCAAPRRSSRCWRGSPREQQIAVLISAHEMNPLLPVMDRIVYLAAGRAASGTAEEVVRTDVLSGLYGHHVDVLRVHGRVLVVAGTGHDEHAAIEPRGRRAGRRDRLSAVHSVLRRDRRAGVLLQLARCSWPP